MSATATRGCEAELACERLGRRVSPPRRRLDAVMVLAVLAAVLTVGLGRTGAEAELADRVDGHVVVAPGDTLWDVAASTAPDGVDTRRQLEGILALNGLDGGEVQAWTVLLLPAR